VAPNPVAHAVIAAGGTGLQALSAVQPTATSFFHELFHLVLGNDVTYPALPRGEVYNLFQSSPQIVGLSYVYAQQNPESYVLAAIAYDYTLNWGVDAAGNAVEFYSGWTTQG
jgi:hypothetical protein